MKSKPSQRQLALTLNLFVRIVWSGISMTIRVYNNILVGIIQSLRRMSFGELVMLVLALFNRNWYKL